MDLGGLLDSCRWFTLAIFRRFVSHCCRLNQLESGLIITHYLTMHVSIIDFRHINFDLSRSLKVKCDGGFGLPTYDFLLVFKSKICPNSAALRDMSFGNLSDPDIEFSRSLKVKCDCHWTWLTSIYV